MLTADRAALTAYYAPELGEPFVTAGMCLYRTGRDSVAWHGDTNGRSAHYDTMVAIVSFGSPRPLLLRPRGGGDSLRFPLGHGDLIVMGGFVPAHLGARDTEDGPGGRAAGERSSSGRSACPDHCALFLISGRGTPPAQRTLSSILLSGEISTTFTSWAGPGS